MASYIIRRLLFGAINVLIISIFVAFILRLMPSDAASATAGEETSVTVTETVRKELGLDRPFPVQYLSWVGMAMRGDFGASFITHEDVGARSKRAILPTAELALFATFLSLLIGFPLGIASAVWRNSLIDHLARLFAVAGVAVPGFWVATLLIVFPALWFGWTPPLRYEPIWSDPGDNLQLMLGAAITVGWAFSAGIARLTRSSTLEILRNDYIRTARAKGVRNTNVVVKHALPNGLLPIMSIIGTEIAILFGGSVIIEKIFSIPGIGRLTYDAIQTRDYPQVQLNVLIFAITLITLNLITDISYGLIDPRVRNTR